MFYRLAFCLQGMALNNNVRWIASIFYIIFIANCNNLVVLWLCIPQHMLACWQPFSKSKEYNFTVLPAWPVSFDVKFIFSYCLFSVEFN